MGLKFSTLDDELGVFKMRVGRDFSSGRLFLLPLEKEEGRLAVFAESYYPEQYIVGEIARQLKIEEKALAFKDVKFKLTVEVLNE